MHDLCVSVIDDDEDVRKGLARLLRALGYGVRVFASAEEFLDQHDSTDCLIIDVQLSGMSGIELEAHLSTGDTPTPVVFITAREEPPDHESTRCRGVQWVHKPFDEQELSNAIARATTRTRDATGE